MKFHPTALAGRNGLENFVALVRGYFDRKGSHMQFNVVSRETLRDAQAHPEKYKSPLPEHFLSALFALVGRVVAACYSRARSRGSPLGGVSLRENTTPWCFYLFTQSRRATNCATPR